MRLGATYDGPPNYFILAIIGIRLVGPLSADSLISYPTKQFMEIKEVEGTQFVKDYTPKHITRLQIVSFIFCVCAVAYFVVRLAM